MAILSRFHFTTVLVCGLAALLGAIAAPCAGGGEPGQPGDPYDAVRHAEKLKPFFLASYSSRVDIVGIGDSNQLFNSTGWDHGWQRAYETRGGLYATGLITVNSGPLAGFRYRKLGSLGHDNSAPAALHRFMDNGGGDILPHKYSYLPDQQAATAASRGLLLERLCPIDLAARLRFHMLMGSFDEGDGTISPRVRIGEAPWTVLASADPVNSVTGSLGDLSMFQIDLPATVERSYPIQFLIDDQNATVQGPLFVLYLRAENRDRQSGVSFHTLLHRGGKGLRTFAEDLILASDDYLSQFFAQVRWLQGEQKHVLVRINSGLNDRNDSTPSVGPNAGYASNTRQGYADNLQAIINRIREVWALNEWPEEELFFLLTPSHAIYLPDDPMLINYRDAAAAVAAENDRTGFVNLNVLADATVMSVNGWWDITGRVHLKQSGYEGLSELEIDALQQVIFRPRRSPDLDGDGAVNAGDLATLLSSWGACEPIPAECVADLDGDGAVNAGDLATLLSRWGTLPEFDS